MKQNAHALTPHWRAALDGHILRLAWSPDGQTLAALDANGPLALFSVDGHSHTLRPTHELGAMDMAWQPGGGKLATCGQDGKIRLWQVASPEPQAEMAGGAAWVEHLAWSPGGDFLASAAGRKIRLWNPDGVLQQEYVHPRSTVAGLAWRTRPDQRDARPPVLAAAGYGGLNFYTPGETACIEEHAWKGSTLVIAWSPDGRFIATGDQDSTVHFWLADSGQDLQMWGYPAKVLQLAWDTSSRYLATGGSDSVCVWDCNGKGPEGSKPLMLKGHSDLISALAYQPGSHLLASGDADGRVCLWQADRNASRPMSIADFEDPVSALAWSPNGLWLAAGNEAGALTVYSVR